MVMSKRDRKRIALWSIIVTVLCVKKKRKKRLEKRKWCKDWLMKRNQLGSHMTILHELQNDNKDFTNYMRMDPHTFHRLLTLVSPAISKQNTIMRSSIPAEARLEATLLFLTTGCSYTHLQYATRISKQSLSHIIPETCQAIYQVLREQYLQVRHCIARLYINNYLLLI